MKDIKRYIQESLFDNDLVEKKPYSRIDWKVLEDIINDIYHGFKSNYKDAHIDFFGINDPETASNYKFSSNVFVKWSNTGNEVNFDYQVGFSFSNSDKRIILGNTYLSITIRSIQFTGGYRFDFTIPKTISWRVREPNENDVYNIYKYVDNFFHGVYKMDKGLKQFIIDHLDDLTVDELTGVGYRKFENDLDKQFNKWFKQKN